MTIVEEFSPDILGEIDDGPFGKVPLYFAKNVDAINQIYTWRQVNGVAEADDGTDEFFFLAPSDKIGTSGDDINYTVNNVTKKETLFEKTKMGEEFFVLYRAFFHLAGIFYEPVKAKDLEVNTSLESAFYASFNLPKIPYKLVDKMDNFFRTVEKKFGTESIVLLIYNFDYKDSQDPELGWGIGIPDQKNTGTHCDYDSANVLAELPSNSRVVGTVHSHPGMRAYASATDHNDQAGFDGVHITYGWSNTTNNATEYHVELVRGNNFTRLDPEEVMNLDDQFVYSVVDTNGEVSFYPKSQVKMVKQSFTVDDKEIESFVSKVDKAWGQNYYQNSSGPTTAKKALAPATSLNSPLGPRSSIDSNKFLPSHGIDLPYISLDLSIVNEPIPDPALNNIFIRIAKDKTSLKSCPLCFMTWDNLGSDLMSSNIVNRRQCMGCGVFVLLGDEPFENLVKVRKSYGFMDLMDVLNFDFPFLALDFTGKDKSKFIAVERLKIGDSKKVSK